MAKDKERSVNPAQAQRKAEKARALKKSRNELQARRSEKLARRNPNTIQRQIADLKSLEASGDIKEREKAILGELERDLQAVLKAREQQGIKTPGTSSAGVGNRFASDRKHDRGDGQHHSVLGKRRYDGGGRQRSQYENRSSSGSETDESVRNIPMPRDTPPPLPRKYHRHNRHPGGEEATDDGPDLGERRRHDLPSKPAQPIHESKTTYSSAPQLRNLTKEATSRFVPDAVRRKQDAVKGQGGQLLEPEEMDKLEQEGYLQSQRTSSRPDDANNNTTKSSTNPSSKTKSMTDEEAKWLQDEEARFESELAQEESPNDRDSEPAELDENTMIGVTGHPQTVFQSNATVKNNDDSHHDNKDISNEKQEEREENDDDDDDDDDDNYLPLSMSGRAISQSQADSATRNTSQPNAASIAAGLFAKLPPPQAQAQAQAQKPEIESQSQSHGDTNMTVSRHVQMEEVEDEES